MKLFSSNILMFRTVQIWKNRIWCDYRRHWFSKTTGVLTNPLLLAEYSGRSRSIPWASYQIHKMAGCACAGNAGNVFPTTVGWGSRHASRHVRHARDVMRDSWLAVSFEIGVGANVSGIRSACTTRNFANLVRGPLLRLPWALASAAIFSIKLGSKISDTNHTPKMIVNTFTFYFCATIL